MQGQDDIEDDDTRDDSLLNLRATEALTLDVDDSANDSNSSGSSAGTSISSRDRGNRRKVSYFPYKTLPADLEANERPGFDAGIPKERHGSDADDSSSGDSFDSDIDSMDTTISSKSRGHRRRREEVRFKSHEDTRAMLPGAPGINAVSAAYFAAKKDDMGPLTRVDLWLEVGTSEDAVKG